MRIACAPLGPAGSWLYVQRSALPVWGSGLYVWRCRGGGRCPDCRAGPRGRPGLEAAAARVRAAFKVPAERAGRVDRRGRVLDGCAGRALRRAAPQYHKRGSQVRRPWLCAKLASQCLLSSRQLCGCANRERRGGGLEGHGLDVAGDVWVRRRGQHAQPGLRGGQRRAHEAHDAPPAADGPRVAAARAAVCRRGGRGGRCRPLLQGAPLRSPAFCGAVLLDSAGRLCRSSVEHPVQRGRALGRLKGENWLLPVLVLRPSADCKTWEEAASACRSCISQALVCWCEQQRHRAAVHVPRSPPHSLRVATAGRACTGLTRFSRSQAPAIVHRHTRRPQVESAAQRACRQ